MLVRKFPSPEYTPFTVWLPTDNVDTDNDALPSVTVALPRDVAPLKNSTVPVGVPVPLVTIACSVTTSPKNDGLLSEVTVVVDACLLTTCVNIEEVLPLWFASPLETAVIE
jgi:hypothetical protein